MNLRFFVFSILLFTFPLFGSGQVRIRVFSASESELALFTVTSGNYEVNLFENGSLMIAPGENVIISRFNDNLYLKTTGRTGLRCDSVLFSGKTGNDSFSLRVSGIRQYYSGDLLCYYDLGSLVLINICDIDSYIAGVIKAEGGSGKEPEYFKTQAVIARTYMYKYFDKHITDRFNLCDNTHCQVYNGICSDTIITRTAIETRGEVILGPDSTLIISTFHSNCGGETSPSEYVWLTGQPYLRKVTDPFCTGSRNAKWQFVLSRKEWRDYLKKTGYSGDLDNPALLNVSQKTRMRDLKINGFSIPFSQIRTDLRLRSAYFSISASGDSVLFDGKGYGHGVGLCQEGAMVMAQKGFDYKQIINFYYSGVFISDIAEAKEDIPPIPNFTSFSAGSEGGLIRGFNK